MKTVTFDNLTPNFELGKQISYLTVSMTTCDISHVFKETKGENYALF